MSQSISKEKKETVDSNQSPKKSGGKAFTLFFIIFALGFGALGAGFLHSAHSKEKAYSGTAEGQIIDYRDYSSYDNKHKFSPIVEYRAEGQIYTGETNVQFNYKPLKTGTYVSIFYNPQKPEEFYIKEYDQKTNYKMGALFLFISIGILFILLLSAVLNRIKMDPKKKEQIQLIVILSVILLFMFLVFACLAGLIKTICIFAAFGLFTLYGLYRNKKKNKR